MTTFIEETKVELDEAILSHGPIDTPTRRLLDWHHAIAERPRRWRSRPGAKGNFVAFDRKNPEAVRRRRATANRVLTYLKAALNHAWRSGVVPSDDAWRRVKPFKAVDAPVVRYLSHDEITRLLNGCQGAFRDLVHPWVHDTQGPLLCRAHAASRREPVSVCFDIDEHGREYSRKAHDSRRRLSATRSALAPHDLDSSGAQGRPNGRR
jgi:hypothetical protein